MAGEDGRVRDVDVRKRGALSLGMEMCGRGVRLASCGRQADSGVDYDLEPMPPVHSPLPENSVPMGDVATFAEEKLDLPVTPGPYEPTWSSIEANYPGTPQ